MIAKELISYYIPYLSDKASVEDALSIMEENKISHLPILKENFYQGIVNEDFLLELDEVDTPLSTLKFNLLRPFVKVYDHVFDIIRVFEEFKLTAIPVLDDAEDFLGVITIQDMAFHFAKITNSHEPGGVLVLSILIRDYSLAQVAQIVESDQAKILAAYVSSSSDSMEMDLTLKINKSDLSAIIKSFERFNYKIKASYHESIYDDTLKDRYNQFMRYLNM